jgi:hypothetical protein
VYDKCVDKCKGAEGKSHSGRDTVYCLIEKCAGASKHGDDAANQAKGDADYDEGAESVNELAVDATKPVWRPKYKELAEQPVSGSN